MIPGIVFSEALVRKGLELPMLCKVMEISPAAIIVTDPTGAIEYANPAFERVTGYTAAEVVGQNPRILKSGSQGPEVYTELWRTITSGGTWTGRMHNRRKDGSLYWESAVISTLCDDEGHILHYIGVKENVTMEVEAIEHANKVLKESEIRFRSYFDLPLHGVCITSPEKGWIEVNDRLCEMLGYAREELVLKTWAEMGYTTEEALKLNVADWDVQWEGAELIAKVRETIARSIAFETRHRRKDGTILDVEISGVCVELDGGKYLYASARDITLRKRADEALRRETSRRQALEQEVKNISESEQRRIGYDLHDGICQELSGIQYVTELIAQRLPDELPEKALLTKTVEDNRWK